MYSLSSSDTLELKLLRQLQAHLTPERALPMKPPETDDELRVALRDVVGISISDVQVCPHHVSPFRAFADAYFARYPVTVWKASRGLAGKSVMLAALSYLETMFLGASVNLLGGSGEQAERVHSYITGEDTNLPTTFWKNHAAPMDLLLTDPTRRETKLTNGGRLKVLMASATSVRGPHPSRLRIDEVDEVDLEILDAALGQPMTVKGIKEQTVLSSTHHHSNGTMTEVLKRAGTKGWKVYTWCYRETLHGWLTEEQVETKRSTVTNEMWNTEYENNEPSPGARAIDPDKVMACFDRSLGVFEGRIGEYIEIEEPLAHALYVHGADWARKTDFTVIMTFRVDVKPYKLVAFKRTHKQPWPVMVGHLEERKRRYGGTGAHDATGLGDVIAGYLEEEVTPVIMQGRQRSSMLNNYIVAIEAGDLLFPYIESLYAEHLYASVDDLYGSGHLPDTISSGSLAYTCIDTSKPIDWSQTEQLGKIEGYEDRSLWR